VFSLAVGCGGAPLLSPVPALTSATPEPLALPAASSAASSTAPAAAYAGHGADTVPPEVLDKYRPTPLSGDVSRRIQALMDVRAPGVGQNKMINRVEIEKQQK